MTGFPPPNMPPGAPTAPPPNYLVPAILTTICCCLPFGVVSIVYAAQVNSKFEGGDFYGALDSSNKAKTWAWVSFGVGIGVGVLYAMGIAGFGLLTMPS